MSGCCSSCSTPLPATRIVCPDCGTPSQRIGRLTLLHQLRHPQQLAVDIEGAYFCPGRECGLAYFDDSGLRIPVSGLRDVPGQKSTSPSRLICYCFNISAGDVERETAEHGASPSRAFVIEQTRAGRCACEIRNPSGRCCLAEFPE